MFDISWSELLILGIVTLVFVGPKELPVFLRTLGRHAGAVRRHANEFKAQFDSAMREAELEPMRKEFDGMRTSIDAEILRAKTSLDEAGNTPKTDNRSASNSPALKPTSVASKALRPPMPGARES